MALIGNLVVNILAKTAQFDKGLKKIRRRLRSFQRSMRPITKVLGNIFRATVRMAKFAALGIGAATVAIIGYAASFEKTMSRVRALTGATAREFDNLRRTAIELGEKTEFTAKQAAEGMSFFALAGFKVNKIIKAMPATLNLAAAGQVELATASDIVAKIMAGMGLEVDQLNNTVDILAKAFTTANTDLLQLGEALSFVGPVAKASGKSLEETTAAIQLLSNAGLQGERAGTALRNILARLTGGTPQATKKLQQLGVRTLDAWGNMLPLANIIEELDSALRNLGGVAAQTGKVMNIFGLRAGPGMSILLAATGRKIREFTRNLEDAGGTAERVARIQLQNLFGKLTRLKSIIGSVAIEIGDLFVGDVTKAVVAVRDWIDDNSIAIREFAGLIRDHLIATVTVLTKQFVTLGDEGENSASFLTAAFTGTAKIIAVLTDLVEGFVLGLRALAAAAAIVVAVMLVPFAGLAGVIINIIKLLNLLPGVNIKIPAALLTTANLPGQILLQAGEEVSRIGKSLSGPTARETLEATLHDIRREASFLRDERRHLEHDRRMEELGELQLQIAQDQLNQNQAFAE